MRLAVDRRSAAEKNWTFLMSIWPVLALIYNLKTDVFTSMHVPAALPALSLLMDSLNKLEIRIENCNKNLDDFNNMDPNGSLIVPFVHFQS